jgi:hypothetical protein
MKVYINKNSLQLLKQKTPRCVLIQNVKNLDEDFFSDKDIVECFLKVTKEAPKDKLDFKFINTWKKFKKLFSK